jgi:hypothetical protein
MSGDFDRVGPPRFQPTTTRQSYFVGSFAFPPANAMLPRANAEMAVVIITVLNVAFIGFTSFEVIFFIASLSSTSRRKKNPRKILTTVMAAAVATRC